MSTTVISSRRNLTFGSLPDETPSSPACKSPLPHFPPSLSSGSQLTAQFRLHDGDKLDFNDPAAMLQLTKTLLKQNFGLKIELPDDRLCPPVPNRHNYILWLKALLDTSSYKKPGGKLCGLDIGTGASCIYPLLGTAQRPWCFVATGEVHPVAE